jgi:hypothetical protein
MRTTFKIVLTKVHTVSSVGTIITYRGKIKHAHLVLQESGKDKAFVRDSMEVLPYLTAIRFQWSEASKKYSFNYPEQSILFFLRFEVFTAVTMKNGVFWDVTLCGYFKNRRF